MINPGTTEREFGSIEDTLGAFASIDGRDLLASPAVREVMTALAREQEHAAMETQDTLTQADEALVMG